MAAGATKPKSKRKAEKKAAYLARLAVQRVRPEPEPSMTTIRTDEKNAGPTIERMVSAGIPIVSDIASRKLKAVSGPEVGRDGVVRLKQSPIDWLTSRGKLDPDPLRNRILHDVGRKYYGHWYEAGLSGIGAMDYGRTSRGSGDPAHQMPTSAHAAHHRQCYRDARASIDMAWMAKVADAVVCEEQPPAEVGRIFGEYASAETRSAITLTILRAALTTLGGHWGMLPKPAC